MRSFSSKRNAGAQSRKRKEDEVSSDGVPVVFKGDESLVQLHAETAELLRLVKTPVKPSKKTSKVSAGTLGKSRLTIEVLEDEDEEDQDVEAPNQSVTVPQGRVDPVDPIDPTAFDAEETRIRQAKDTFYPDMRPSKYSVEWQKTAFEREQNRQEEIVNEERLRADQMIRKRQRKREQTLENRLETSATLIQAHSRGFLCRRRHQRQVEADSSTNNSKEPETDQWHEVRDIERGEVWYYNATTGVSQWEPPSGQAFTPAAKASRSLPVLNSPSVRSLTHTTQRSHSAIDALPPLSPSCSSARSASSDQEQQHHMSGVLKRAIKSPRLPSLQPELTSSPNPWECDSVLPSERSISSEQTDMDQPSFDRRRSSLFDDRDDLDEEDSNSDWQTNDTLFRADGTKNSRLRDTIRSALRVSKFDSISSLIASNVVLGRKSPGKGSHNQGTRRREIVLGKREEPVLVAVLARDRGKTKGEGRSESPGVRSKAKAASRGRKPPHIRDLADPGFLETTARRSPKKNTQQNEEDDPDAKEAARREAVRVCFNCWSASNGRHCDLHTDPREATRKVRTAESALMCANWELDQLRRKYRAEEIQEIFMKQQASLRYDRQLKQYVTVIECRHPIYRAVEQLSTAWNKTMRRKLHTRSWFRSFLEQIRTNRLPRALGGKDSRPPSLFKLKGTLQNARWVSQYSESVCEFHPKAPVTTKDRTGNHPVPLRGVIMINPAHPQLRNWILVTEYTKPIALYKPRVYQLPPPRCVPMPVPTFLERMPLPVPNVHIDAGHSASWLERLSARMAAAARQKAALQIGACSPPQGSTDARRTKHVRPLVVLFATFSRKPTPGNLDVGGLSAELLIHMLVTTYIPAQFGNFVVFDRRAVAPSPSRDETASFACLFVDPKTPEYVYRALQHALNVRRPPCIVIAARVHLEPQLEARRFPVNRPEQTGEEEANGFRTFWLVDPFVVNDLVPGVQVAPSSSILAPNVASMNATLTTKVDRSYPFCVPTTRENTPVEFIHLLWIGQSSRNQPQAFTTLGRQQPGDFMKNSNPEGALGLCSSIVYRSWAYMQNSPYDEFVTEDGVAYWYNRNTGDTFWTRPILPTETFRGKDGDIDGVIATGEGEMATLGVGLGSGDADAGKDEGAARYSQQNLRKYITKKMEAPGEKERRVKLVTASAKKHDIVVDLNEYASGQAPPNKVELTRIQVPQLSLKRHQQRTNAGSRTSSASSMRSRVQIVPVPQENEPDPVMPLDSSTKQMIDTITQALGPALSQANGAKGSGVDMLQLGIGLGMGLGLRVQQQSSPTKSTVSLGSSSQSDLARKLQSDIFDEDEDDEDLSTSSRSDVGSVTNSLLSSRSGYSVALSVDFSPTPDDVELSEPHVGKKTPGYKTHPPPGEGSSWVKKPVDASGESQTAVEGFGGALHQRVACLPKDFVAAVTSSKTCQMQANYLPIVKNMNQPRSVGIVRPRGALDEWLTVGYSPWTAGRAVFDTQFIENLMLRPELVQSATDPAPSTTGAAKPVPQVEKRDAVSQAVKEADQLDTILSLCRHGKYDEVELLLNSPDWSIGIDAKDVTGNTLLSVACQNNNKRIAKLCMRRGADINTQNLNGQSLLHYCHEYGFHDLMEYLMEKGARDDLLNADGLTCYEGLSQEAVDAI
ncbi:Acyl-CoA-binding domain-containing protein 6 [Phytophthora citrophthora]|uniref:Acyl-CoA-binding domain-containing protein 6 n=1 Tax=Phytophthora citrophthora TaxID=4793 RepID=A0AAD9LN17_9STRA|nr:Acyl-CoA-binding domain-containing protein 6 [Phytophthora citrophthora]